MGNGDKVLILCLRNYYTKCNFVCFSQTTVLKKKLSKMFLSFCVHDDRDPISVFNTNLHDLEVMHFSSSSWFSIIESFLNGDLGWYVISSITFFYNIFFF